MARLSSPENVLEKFEQIYEKVDEICQTVELVRDIRNRADAVCQDMAGHEVELRDRLGDVARLERACEENITWLKSVGTEGEEILKRIQAGYSDEAARIRDVLITFSDREARIEKYRDAADHEISHAVQEATGRMAWFSEEIASGLQAMQLETVRRSDELRAVVDEAVARLMLTAETASEEIGHLEENLEAFRNRLSALLDDRTEALVQQQKIYEENATYALHTRFDEDMEKFRSEASGELQKIHSQSERQQDVTDRTVEQLLGEKDAVARQREAIALEMTQIRQEMNELTQTSGSRLDKAIGDGHQVIEREMGHVASFITDSEREIQELKGDLKTFRDRVSAGLKKETARLIRQQSDFEQTLTRDMDTRLSEEIRQFRLSSEKELQNLLTEKKEISEMHQVLEDALDQVNRKIQGKTTFFATQLNNLVVNSRKEISQAATDAARQVEERLNQLSGFAEETRSEFRTARENLNSFGGQIRERLTQDTDRLFKQQNEFQKKAAHLLGAKLNDEVRTLRQSMIQEVKQHLETLAGAQAKMRDNLMKRMATFDQRIASIEEGQKQALELQKQKHSETQGVVKKISENQSAQGDMLPGLDQRLRDVEAFIEALRQKKGLLSFLK